MTDTTDNNTGAARNVAQIERHTKMTNTNTHTLGARCFDQLHRYVGYKWLQGRAIQERLDLWHDALVAAFDAVADHDHDRVIAIPALPDSDTAINILSNWDSYLGHGAIWDILEDAVEEARGAESAQLAGAAALAAELRSDEDTAEREIFVVFRTDDLELRVLWFEVPSDGRTDGEIVAAAAWFVEDETGVNPGNWAATTEIVRPS